MRKGVEVVSYAIPCRTTDESDEKRDTLLGAVRLPMRPESVAAARRFVADVTRLWGVPSDVVDVLELLCSEVVTNAVVHPIATPGSAVDVFLIRDGANLIVECRDPSRSMPTMRGDLDP